MVNHVFLHREKNRNFIEPGINLLRLSWVLADLIKNTSTAWLWSLEINTTLLFGRRRTLETRLL